MKSRQTSISPWHSLALAMLGLPTLGLLAQSRLPTVAEATKLSAATGRPIFAMAGRKT